MTDHTGLQQRITDSYVSDGEEIDLEAVNQALTLLDEGEIRVMQRDGGAWVLNEWVKQAVLLYFRCHDMKTIDGGFFEYRDKVPVKTGWERRNVRVVPPAVARFGSYVAPGVVLMPSYVNIGAYVDSGTMVDTWATVGSCAQVGKDVHLAGGVGIGGVLEPLQASPVVIEDGAFIGSRCVVVEGARVGTGAVLGANVVVTGSTPIIDVTGDDPIEHRGSVPSNAVVIPGTRSKTFPAGEYSLPCGIIIGWRDERVDSKVRVNELLRDAGAGV